MNKFIKNIIMVGAVLFFGSNYMMEMGESVGVLHEQLAQPYMQVDSAGIDRLAPLRESAYAVSHPEAVRALRALCYLYKNCFTKKRHAESVVLEYSGTCAK